MDFSEWEYVVSCETECSMSEWFCVIGNVIGYAESTDFQFLYPLLLNETDPEEMAALEIEREQTKVLQKQRRVIELMENKIQILKEEIDYINESKEERTVVDEIETMISVRLYETVKMILSDPDMEGQLPDGGLEDLEMRFRKKLL
eukprot:TRINITY_DN1289_c0_g1_i2.p1 TRINITY_DN1289_c0_g1~~TRINITY_DN1289_c0_g1_i2.p1  ORF type:complete len:146 (-),score=38.84 TRINITY_DN1289_c0_g1_i2:12-449(-)